MEAERVGKTIAYLRKRAGLKQWELAEQLGVTDKAVSRWERGLGVPDQSLLPMLADVLCVQMWRQFWLVSSHETVRTGTA